MQSFEVHYYSVKSIEEIVATIEQATKLYLRSLKNLARQVYTSSSDLMKSSTLAVLQGRYDDLAKLHLKLLQDHSGSNLFNLLKGNLQIVADPPEESPIVCRNFQAVRRLPPASPFGLRANEFNRTVEMDFETVKLKSSVNKEPSHFDFETHAAHLQVLPDAEGFDIGHIYCGAMIKPKIHLFCGKFGTVISNAKDNIVGRVDLHVEKTLNVVSRNNLQIYFGANDKPAVWSGLNEKLRIDALFLAESSASVANTSKLVHEVDEERVYFASAAHRIMLVRWSELEDCVYKAQKTITGTEVLMMRNLADFYVTKTVLVAMNERGFLIRVFLNNKGLVATRSEFEMTAGPNFQYHALTGDENQMVVALSQLDSVEVSFTLLSKEYTLCDTARVGVELAGLNQVRQLYWIAKPHGATFVLAVWMYNVIDLFAVDTNSITQIERHQTGHRDDRIRINGCIWNTTKTKLLVFGDFNFQRHLLLRL